MPPLIVVARCSGDTLLVWTGINFYSLSVCDEQSSVGMNPVIKDNTMRRNSLPVTGSFVFIFVFMFVTFESLTGILCVTQVAWG